MGHATNAKVVAFKEGDRSIQVAEDNVRHPVVVPIHEIESHATAGLDIHRAAARDGGLERLAGIEDGLIVTIGVSAPVHPAIRTANKVVEPVTVPIVDPYHGADSQKEEFARGV